jgi:diguanylate cyclase (GGDEF)-like protein/PAS domain S-box-containing protein
MLAGKLRMEAVKLSSGEFTQFQGFNWPQTEPLFRQIVLDAWDTISLFDPSGSLLFASSSHENNIGFVPAEMDEMIARVDSEYRVDMRKLFFNAVQYGKKGRLEFRFQILDGSWLWFETLALPIRLPDGTIYQIAFMSNDITAKKLQEAKLIAMAYHDPLTGLPNRRRFKEHLHQEILYAKRTGKMMALLYLDLDDFKIINDTMGHDVGDAFLQAFSHRVRSCLREVDLFSRMGGDEFTILLPLMDSIQSVETVAKRIFHSIEEPYQLDGKQFQSSISMGIALYPTDGEDASVLLKKVDIALYHVKGRGRNGYQFYSPEMFMNHN